jgi:polyisoprenoid-binding protein YceI
MPEFATWSGGSFAAGTQVSIELHGRLTIRDATRDVMLETKAAFGDGKLTVDGETNFSFLDFGVPDPSNLFLHVRPEMTVAIHIEATRAD